MEPRRRCKLTNRLYRVMAAHVSIFEVISMEEQLIRFGGIRRIEEVCLDVDKTHQCRDALAIMYRMRL